MSIITIDDCWNDIIGITRTACECWGAVPEDYTVSLSGKYLEDEIELATWEGLLNCQRGDDLYTMMDRAREQAILTTRADLIAMLMKKNQLKRSVYTGRLGYKDVSPALITSGLTAGNWYGLKINTGDIRGGIIKITGLTTHFDTTGQVSVYVFNNLWEEITSVDLNTVAGLYEDNTVSIELPLYDENIQNLCYYVVWESVGTEQPYKVPLTYSSCSQACHNADRDRWLHWIRAWGANVDSSNLADCCTTGVEYSYGILPKVELKCDVGELFCPDIDFYAEPLAPQMAEAVLKQAIFQFSRQLNTTTNLNYASLINREVWMQIAEASKASYQDLLFYIAENIDITKNDCLMCRDPYNFRKGNVI